VRLPVAGPFPLPTQQEDEAPTHVCRFRMCRTILSKWSKLMASSDGMVEINNGVTFQCYFSKAESFDGIFLKSGSFNGMDLIFPSL
jgi:hypothetical protein